VLVVALCSCKFHPPTDTGSDGAIDVSKIDTPPGVTGHLLLTEIQPNGNFEFIEIYNPTDLPVDLSTYYLSDSNEYWKLSAHIAGTSLINLISSDFVVQFPPSTLAPDAVAVVAMDGPGFVAEYGTVTPRYTIRGQASGAMQMINVIPVTAQQSTITDSGEMVVLFQWDGVSDLVRDVDLVVAGNSPDPANAPAPKQDVDGVDGDIKSSSYAHDDFSIGDMATDAGGKMSFKRLMREGTNERRGGGNGITGDDETSEQQRLTWDDASSIGTPGVIPLTLR